jgi:hypothetical protein
MNKFSKYISFSLKVLWLYSVFIALWGLGVLGFATMMFVLSSGNLLIVAVFIAVSLPAIYGFGKKAWSDLSNEENS